jgi:hypothetical protein
MGGFFPAGLTGPEAFSAFSGRPAFNVEKRQIM